MKLLHVDSSILGEDSVSRKVSAAVVAHLVEIHPGTQVTTRDLAAQPLSHLSGAYLAGQNSEVKHDHVGRLTRRAQSLWHLPGTSRARSRSLPHVLEEHG